MKWPPLNILDLIFPRRCVSCGILGSYLCPKCRQKIRLIETAVCPVCERPAINGATHPKCLSRYSLDGLISIWVYDGLIKAAIKHLKYRLVSDLAQELIDLAKPSFKVKEFSSLTLVPVPLHWQRLRWRGFNQAEILGELVAERLGTGFETNLLVRSRATKPQVELKNEERRENITNAFAINPRYPKTYHLPSRILLFDDVWTTGATLRTAAMVLKRAGVQKVWGLTLAR